MATIRFGHSPDPDDAFMFYAIAHGKIDTHGYQVDHVVEDIESLNHRALKHELEATAISVHAYAYLSDAYAIMRAGASMGDQYGPIIVSKKTISPSELKGKTVAIPGKLTTANLILQLFEKQFSPVLVPFDQILDYVKAGKADAGLVIHEGQITYGENGLKKVIDLGEWWWQETHLPLPLGVDAVRKDLGSKRMREISTLFKESILYSLENRKDALAYAMPFGRGISLEAGDKFVGMYVNEYTKDLGPKGEAGIREVLLRGYCAGILSKLVIPEFV